VRWLPAPLRQHAVKPDLSGWVAGAGVDWARWSNDWTVRVEYLHYHLQGATSTSVFPDNSGVAAYPTWNNVSVNSVRAGLSYKFW
jgi:opacity protein-like surface antigen